MINHIVLGHCGEVGSTVYNFLREVDKDVMGYDPADKKSFIPRIGCTFLHICVPYSEDFVRNMKRTIGMTCPQHVIVYSSVLPGTTEQLGENAVHSPIEGKHPHLISAFHTFTRMVAGKDAELVGKFFSNRGLKVTTYTDAKITEIGKLLSTTRYGLNIVFAKSQKDLCDQLGVNYDQAVLDYQRMYNEGYKKIGGDRFAQPLMVPPGDAIGGHCVVPNANLLGQITKDELIKKVAEYGK
jgi:UDP-N-acetyl-D-mannosaminuronate dehydrogenase